MKRLIFSLIAALIFAAPAFADINFNAQFNFTGTTVGASATAAPGGITINAFNTNASSMFSGVGGNITGTYQVNSDGSLLDTTVNAGGVNGSNFQFSGASVLSGYTNNLVGVGAYASGLDTSGMNLTFNGSSYTNSLSRIGGSLVTASGTTYSVGVSGAIQDKDTNVQSANGSIEIGGNGAGTIDHSTTWYATSLATGNYGWGNPDTLSMSSSAHSETGLINVVATGSGSYLQSGFGLNSLTYNGAVMPGGGSMITTGSFGGGFTFSPSILGN